MSSSSRRKAIATKEVALLNKMGKTMRRYVKEMKMPESVQKKLIQAAKKITFDWYRYHLQGITLTRKQIATINRDIEKMTNYVFGRYSVSTSKMISFVFGMALIILFIYFSYQYDQACSLPSGKIEGSIVALYRGGQRLMGQVPACEKNREYHKAFMVAIGGLGAYAYARSTAEWIMINGKKTMQNILGGRRLNIKLEWTGGNESSSRIIRGRGSDTMHIRTPIIEEVD